jgi:ribosome-binding protein aMBF1 (putative translation factor)
MGVEGIPLACAPYVAQTFRPRRMTVSYIKADTPYLRFRGQWLYRAGFGVGTPVRVEVSDGRLVVEAVDPKGQSRCAEVDDPQGVCRKCRGGGGARRRRGAKSHPVKVRPVMACYDLLEPAVAEAVKEVLRSARLDRPLRIGALAQRAQLRSQLIQALEEGTRLPTLPVFIVLAWSLGLDPRELLDRMLRRMNYPDGSKPAPDNGAGFEVPRELGNSG